MSMTGSTRLSNAASAPLRRPRAASGRLLRGVLALSPRVSALYTSLCCFLFFALLSNAAAASPKSASSPLNATQAQDQFYSMELEQAADSYRKLLAVDPENPDYWTSLAHVYLFQQLQRMGKFENDIFPAAAAITPAGRAHDPVLATQMWDALGRARNICEKRLQRNPRDLDANYFMGIAYALESNYQISVARKFLDALDPATKAKDYHLKVLQIDPQNHDANLVIGTYEYGIGSIPFAFRWIARIAGHTGTKEHGMQLITDAMLKGKRGPAPALIMLAYIHNREKQYDYSQQMLDQLARFYPRNSFYELQVASSLQKAGDLRGAAEVFRNIERKTEQGAPGFANKVDLPRLRFQLATTYENLRQRDLALNYYRLILPWESGKKTSYDTPQPLQAYAYLRMANLRRELGHRDAAREYYQKALEFNLPEIQKLARNALKKLSE